MVEDPGAVDSVVVTTARSTSKLGLSPLAISSGPLITPQDGRDISWETVGFQLSCMANSMVSLEEISSGKLIYHGAFDPTS